jgi:hypothetical protein
MIGAVSLRLVLLIFQQVLDLVRLTSRTDSTKDVQLLVLRHEVQQPHRHLHRVCDHRIAEHEWLSTCANRCVACACTTDQPTSC